jgi:chorismate dehydratase
MAKQLGIMPETYARIISDPLKDSGLFSITENPSAINTIRYREMQLDAVLMPPLDFARESSQMKVVPEIAISSDGTNDVVVLHFRQGIHDIRTMAANPAFASEIVLARIILAEEFEHAPAIVPSAGSIEEMLAKADSALMVGDMAFNSSHTHPNRLNVVKAWKEMTRLPYVHALWAGREGSMSKEEVEKLQKVKQTTGEEIRRIARQSGAQGELLEEHLYNFQFDFTEDVENAVIEFFRYSYYHGILPDIPELSYFFSADSQGQPPGDPIL